MIQPIHSEEDTNLPCSLDMSLEGLPHGIDMMEAIFDKKTITKQLVIE